MQVKEGVQVRAQQEAIVDMVGVLASVGLYVCRLQRLLCVTARHRILPSIGPQQSLAKPRLAPTPHDSCGSPFSCVLVVVRVKRISCIRLLLLALQSYIVVNVGRKRRTLFELRHRMNKSG
jgi:hypothetical protein